jgi:hypothetical protein
MADFQNSFTGKDILSPLPSGAGLAKSQETMGDMLIAAEKTKYDIFQKNAADFQKAVNIDPVAVLGDINTQVQSKHIQDFNTKWAAIKQQSGDHLSDDQKVKMQSEKNVIIMEQNKMLSDTQQYMAAKDAMQKDGGRTLDADDFKKREANLFAGHGWDSSPLLPAKKDPDLYFGNDSHKLNFGATKNTVTKKNDDGTETTVNNVVHGTEQQGRNGVAAAIHTDDGLARGIIEKFQALKTTDPETYKKYLDTNNDGVLSPEEEKQATISGSNPILKWAQDNYWDKILKPPENDTSQKPETTKKTSNLDINIGGTKITAPGIKRDAVTIGTRTYSQPYSFGGQKFMNVSTQGATQIDADGTETKLDSGNMEGNLLHYDAARDILVFSNAASTKNPYLGSNDLVEVPADNLAGVNSLPIKIGDRMGTVGELRNSKTQTVVKKKAY